MTRICGLSSLAASFKLLILKQDKQRINNLAEHRQPGSSQVKGSREASAASSPPRPQQLGDSFAPSPSTLPASPMLQPPPLQCLAQPGGRTLFLRGTQPCQQQQGLPPSPLCPPILPMWGLEGQCNHMAPAHVQGKLYSQRKSWPQRMCPRGEPCPPKPPEGCPAGAEHAPIQL